MARLESRRVASWEITFVDGKPTGGAHEDGSPLAGQIAALQKVVGGLQDNFTGLVRVALYAPDGQTDGTTGE